MTTPTTEPIIVDLKSLPIDNVGVYSSPFQLRRTILVENRFINRPHNGIDLPVGINTAIKAVEDGVATWTRNPSGYGLYIDINHTGKNYISRYAHLNQVRIGNGDFVKAGTIIGYSGGDPNNPPNNLVNAGLSTGPHLHFEIILNGTPIDPLPSLERKLGQSFQKTQTSTRTTSAVANILKPPGITPYIASLDSFHPNIQYELTRRSYATETIHSHMPFVKLTSLSFIAENNRSGGLGAYCPTLGPHGEKNITFEEIYTPQDGRSAIGYATYENDNGTFTRQRVIVEETAGETDAPNIPMPGIISMSTERSTAGPMGIRGGLFKANVKIMAHSVSQLNALLRYFLRPATRVVLEFGRMSSNPAETIVPFDWKRSIADITAELRDIVVANKNQREFIQQYVYNNNGNYDIFIGYVVNFKVNYTGKNTYEIDLTIHSIQQFEVPVQITGAQSLCKDAPSYIDPCKVIDISGYFNPGENWSDDVISFNKLLAAVVKGDNAPAVLQPWRNHVITLLKGESDASDSYLISWKFFTDVVMNDQTYGLPKIFQLLENVDLETKKLLSRSTIVPFNDSFLDIKPDKLQNAQVSWHKNLRSINPSVMVIYNKTASPESSREQIVELIRRVEGAAFTSDVRNEDVENKIIQNQEVGSFDPIVDSDSTASISSLYKGIWLNSTVIIKAFESVDTLSMAINKLLVDMNTATEGFWNLQLLSDDTNDPGIHVVDMGSSKQINKSIRPDTDITQLLLRDFSEEPDSQEDFDRDTGMEGGKNIPKYLYQFNRKTKQFGTNDIGSELLDIKLEASLPQVIAVQAIAGIGGVAQQGTWEAINIEELKQLTLFPEVYPNCNQGDRRNTNNVCGNQSSNQSSINFTDPYGPRGTVTEQYRRLNRQLTGLVKKFIGTFGSALWLFEPDKISMMKQLTTDAEFSARHPFNSSNLTKTTVDLTLPGIGGIQLFQAFSVARVPNILNSGYYVVTKVGHEFTTDRGWITKIQGRFRYKPRRQQVAFPGSMRLADNINSGGGEYESGERIDIFNPNAFLTARVNIRP
jgi:hypothetical protein